MKRKTNTGAFIRQMREEAKLTQEELADKIGVTQVEISRWENGVHEPSAFQFIQIRQATKSGTPRF